MIRLVRLLVVALVAWSGSGFAFDHEHAAWTALLKAHVVWLPGGHESRVSYDGFQRDRPALKRYLDTLSAVKQSEFDGWSKPQRLAFLINAYNAFTVELILSRWPDLQSIRDFGTLFNNPWKKRFFELLGASRSLDDVEHGMIRAKGAYDDPRIHVAANCASIGCPALRDEAYVAQRLDAQLDDQMRRFLSDRTRNRYDKQSSRLEVSKIFDWYGKDFAQGYRGWTSVKQFLAQYADLLSDDPPGRERVRGQQVTLSFLDYDWALNATAKDEAGKR